MARGSPARHTAGVAAAPGAVRRRSVRSMGAARALLIASASLALASSLARADEAWTKAPWDTTAFRLPFPTARLVGGGGAAGHGEEARPTAPASFPPAPAPTGGRVSSMAGPAGLWGAGGGAVLPPAPTPASSAPPPWAAAHTAAVSAAPALACDVCLALATAAWEAGAAWVATEGGAQPAPHRVARHMRAACDGGTGPPGGATPLGSAPRAALAGAGLKRVEGGEGGEGGEELWVRVPRAGPATTPTPLEAAAARQACLALTDGPPPPLPGPGPGGGGAAYAHHGPPATAVLGAGTPLPPAPAAVADALAALATRTAAAYAAAGRTLRPSSRPLRHPRSPPASPPTPGGTAASPSPAPCADYHPECAAWAGRGECERNVRYMAGDLALDGDRPPAPAPGSGGSGGSGRGGGASGGRPPTHWRGHCRLSCGLCAPAGDAALPPGPPLEGEPAVALGLATASLRAAALLRACVAAPPCGGTTADAAAARAALAAVAGGARLSVAPTPGAAGPLPPPPPPAEQQPPQPSHPSLHLGPFAGKCFLIPAGYWTFEACPGASVRQAHHGLGGAAAAAATDPAAAPGGPPPSHSLGRSAGALHGGAPRTMPPSDLTPDLADRGAEVRFVAEAFSGGDACEGGGKDGAPPTHRSAELRLACPPDALVRATVAEPEACRYVLTLFHPDACALTGQKEEEEEEARGREGVAVVVVEGGAEKSTASEEVWADALEAPPDDAPTPPAEDAAREDGGGGGGGADAATPPPADDRPHAAAAAAPADADADAPPGEPVAPPPPLPLVHEEL